MSRPIQIFRLGLLAVVLVHAGCASEQTGPDRRPVTGQVASVADSTFARLHGALSEPGGYFDTDNLISNESSYAHVLGALTELDIGGGAYLGVGPDQNFAYIAAIRPRLAFIVDLRRDNALEHLLFKAIFEAAPTRVEYLSLLVGRQAPPDPAAWVDATVDNVVGWVDGAGYDPEVAASAHALVDSSVAAFGIPLTDEDRTRIRGFHDEFIANGLDLRFHSYGRAPRSYYPTLRALLLADDLSSRRGGYLSNRDDYRFLREMQRRNLVIPVVGDLAGGHALRAIAAELRVRGEAVSALYVSNVEFYLFQNGIFDRFAENVRTLPIADRAVLIRSYFPNGRALHPHAVPGYYSTQSLQTLASFVEATEMGGYRSYPDLAIRDAIDPGVGALTH